MYTVEDHSDQRLDWHGGAVLERLMLTEPARVEAARQAGLSKRDRRRERLGGLWMVVAPGVVLVPLFASFASTLKGSGTLKVVALVGVFLILCVGSMMAIGLLMHRRFVPLQRDTLLAMGLCGACGQSLAGLLTDEAGFRCCAECGAKWRVDGSTRTHG